MLYSTTWVLVWILGLLIVAYISYRTQLLSKSGLVGFLFISLGAYVGFGIAGFVYVFAILLSTGIVTRFHYSQKAAAGTAESGHGARGVWKILGAAGLTGLVGWYAFFNNSVPIVVAFVASLAETSSDTWASEIGALTRGRTISILPPWSNEKPGSSGAISLLGEIMAILGACSAVVLAAVSGLGRTMFASFFIASVIGAVIGEHVDSLLGASIQGLFLCPTCKATTERHVHECGTNTELVRGLKSLSNERVNFLCTIAGSACAVFFVLVMGNRL
jgi:uncharacterized protein (TIGR00297 family)